MKQEIYLSGFMDEFKECNRDYYSYEGYKALFDYYDELDENWSLDVIAICCEVTEYDENEIIETYCYLVDGEEFEDNEDKLDSIIEQLEQHTHIIKLENDSFLVWEF